MRVFIHIGLHKTGTTLIQNALLESRDILAEEGWLYPCLPPGFANHSVTFFNAFSSISDCTRYYHNVKRGIQDIEAEQRSALQSILSALSAGAENVIFSGEEITRIKTDGLRRLSEFISSKASEVHIIVYAREPVSYSTSALLESVKHGNLIRKDMRSIPLPLFREKIGPFLTIFGKDRCRIRLFERRSADQLVDTFCQSLDMPRDLALRVYTKGHENPAISAEAVSLINLVNLLWPEFVGGKYNQARARDLTGWLAKIQGQPFHLSPDAIQYVKEQSKEDVKWLEQELGRDPFPGWQDREPISVEHVRAWEPETLASIASMFNDLLKHIARLESERDQFLTELNASVAPYGDVWRTSCSKPD